MKSQIGAYLNRQWMPEPEPVLSTERPRIPICEPDLGPDERRLVNSALDQRWISGRTPVVCRLERDFAQFVGVPSAITCNSGGSALTVMLRACGVTPGDEVIVPSFTMIATAGAVSLIGAMPVFVDCDPDTLNLDTVSVASAVSPRTKAVIAVHLYGHPCNMAVLRELCSRHNLLLLEDAAEAFGSQIDGRRCGGLGDAAAFGFYANKTITAGEGGMVTTADSRIAERASAYRDYCFTPGYHFWHSDLGHSYRMPTLSAALCMAQLHRCGDILAKRRAVARRYHASLAVLPCASKSMNVSWEEHSWWHYWVRTPRRREVRSFLADQGIETRPAFVPMHLQPCYRSMWPSRTAPGGCLNAERAGREVLLLPSHSRLDTGTQDFICEQLLRATDDARTGA